jgi:ElaB/YqjD/DUF883 family membrane-anchored ribosome-binding protein
MNESAVAAAAPAADMLTAVISGIDCAGRVLAAPNAALPVPGGPLARLWHAATVLREHRGDGHVAALVAAGLDGCEALVLRAGLDLSREMLQPIRGWADADWEQAAGRLAGRGWLAPDGRLTTAGAAAHRAIEQATDLAAARPWASLGPGQVAGLLAAVTPAAKARCGTSLRRRVRRGPGRLRADLGPHRLPGGIRADRRADPGRGPGRLGRAEGRGQRRTASVSTSRARSAASRDRAAVDSPACAGPPATAWHQGSNRGCVLGAPPSECAQFEDS